MTQPNTNFNVNLQSSYKISGCRLKIISIPLTYYNINSSNDTLVYTDSFGGYPIIITNGFYSITSLIAEVNQRIAQIGGILNLAYNSNTGLFSLTQADNSIFYVTPGGYSFFDALGFPTTGWASVGTYQANTVSDVFINSDYLKLNINYLNTNSISINNINDNSTFLIELNTDIMTQKFGDTLFVQNNIDDSGGKQNTYDEPITLQNFTVSLCDKYNNPLNSTHINKAECIKDPKCGYCSNTTGGGKCILGTPDGPADLQKYFYCNPEIKNNGSENNTYKYGDHADYILELPDISFSHVPS
jgi:hypothetical protein